jgi:hypothetical protein
MLTTGSEKHILKRFLCILHYIPSGEPIRAKLSKLDGQKPVVVYWEDENETHFAEIDGISVKKGIPKNLANGKAGFEFDRNGPASYSAGRGRSRGCLPSILGHFLWILSSKYTRISFSSGVPRVTVTLRQCAPVRKAT